MQPSELERLAAEGRQRQAQFAAETKNNAHEDRERELRIALGAHFGTPARGVLTIVHLAAFSVLAVGLFLSVTKSVSEGLSAALTLGGGLPSFILIFVRAFSTPTATPAMRAAEQSWYQSLPFAVSGYFEALTMKPQLQCRLRIELQFASHRTPTPELFSGVVQRLDPAAVVLPPCAGWAAGPISGNTGIKINNVRIYRNHRIVKYTHNAVDQILLPLHREYPLRSVHIIREF